MTKQKPEHPDIRDVVFLDISNGQTFRIQSTAQTAETVLWEDGKEYPLVKVEISSASHPAFAQNAAGDQRETSRSDAFRAKYRRLERRDYH